MTATDPRLARLHELLALLTEQRFAGSLAEVEQALARWRAGELETVSAHEAVVRHVERADAIMREAMAAAQHPDELLAAAVSAGFVDEAERAALTQAPLPTLAEVAPPAAERPKKRVVADALLAKEPILVHLDARRAGVEVPARFVGDAKLVLRFGYGLTPPIPDLVVDDDGITGTLVFGGVPFRCHLPWTAIYALILDGESRGMVWPEDAPEPVAADGEGDAGEAEPEPDPDPEPPRRARRPSHLRLVD